MADVLRIKRRTSGAPGAPTSLANAEIAYNEIDHTLYYGEGTGGAGGTASVVVPIAGSGLASNASPAMDGTPTPGSSALWSRGDHIHPTDISRAPLASPGLTGIPTAPTAAPGTATTQIATTAFVSTITPLPSGGLPIMDGVAYAGALATWSRGDHVHPTDTTRAPLDSPNFTGVPTAPNPANGTNTQQLATTSYVLSTRLDQFQAPNTDVNWANHKITGLADPTQGQDAVNKQYVDAIAQGIDAKLSVRAASTGDVAVLSGVATIDGVALAAGDRVLLKDQTAPQQNGIWIVQAGAWVRSTDADTWPELVSAFTFVEGGATNGDVGYLCTVDPGGTLGTTPITWTQFSSAGQVSGGAGLVKSGSVLDVVGTPGRIAVGPDNVDIDPAYVGQTSIGTVGNVTSGTWNATTIAVARGGSGATSLTGYLVGNGTGPFTAVASIPSSGISGLGTMSIQNANAVAITGGTIDGVTFDCGTF
jgi:hypothetical protein